MKLTLKTSIQRNNRIMHSRIDDEVVMMTPDMKEYLAMNPTGAIIWEMLENPLTVEKIIEQLLLKFDIDKDTCEKETMEYIDNLLKSKIIEIV